MKNREINFFRIEKCALDLLKVYGIQSTNYEIMDLCAAEGLTVRVGALSNIDAWLVRTGPDRGIIRLNDRIIENGRTRFSIAHELGHWKLHPNISQGFLCTTSDLADYINNKEEIEANYFAANLLMPKKWIRQETWKCDPSFDIISKLAKEFSMTLTASSRRYVELSKRGIVLIFSKTGIVQWIFKSQKAKFLFIDYGSEIPRYSVTWDCFQNGTYFGEMDKLDPSIWFKDRQFSHDSELFEEARVSRKYGWALTLLWIPELD